MFKKNILLIIITLLVCISLTDIYAGGDRRNGTAGAQELLLPVGAHGFALSSSYVAGLEGIETIFYNPAGLGAMKKSAEAMFSHMSYIADIGVSYAAVAVRFEGFGSIAFNVKTIDFGEIPVTTVQSPYGTGSTFSPTFVVAGITYSNAITDRVRVGVTANIITEKILATSASGLAFTAGVQYYGIAGVEGLKFGIVLKNIGPQMKFDGADLLRTASEEQANRGLQNYKIDAAGFELPSQLELGLAYEKNFTDDFKALLSTSFTNNNFLNDEYKFGGELSYANSFFVRGGYTYTKEGADNPQDQQLFGPTFGAGFNVNAGIDVTVDYGYRWARYFDANHMFSVKLGF
ncbi:MAG: PorV/PorQ family protein [Ignavibacteriales bacterium]|nr:PorV/PorQ family protein [Ignavibacteriales bacterium]